LILEFSKMVVDNSMVDPWVLIPKIKKEIVKYDSF
jgi:hypothetical protein